MLETNDENLPSQDSGSRKRLWIVSELYYPEDTSTGYHLTQIAEGLTKYFSVGVLCGQPTYSQRGRKASRTEIRNSVEIVRARGTTLNKDVIPFRLVNMVTLGLSIFACALRRFRKGENVMVVTTPPTMPFIVALASLLRGAKYTVLVHDNHPETLIAAGKIAADSLVADIVRHANRWLYKHASKIVVIGRDMEALVRAKTAGLDIPIVNIPMWADIETVTPESRCLSPLLKRLGILDKFVLLYSGNMGTTHDLESIFKCAEKLGENKDIHFLFVGGGAKRKWLEKENGVKKLPNVTLLERQPREELNTLLNACDVALVAVVDKMLGVSVPSRAANIMSVGKPILAMTDPQSELALIIDEEKAGWHVPCGDADLLLRKIQEISGTTHEIAVMGKNARTAAITRYKLNDRLRKYAEALR